MGTCARNNPEISIDTVMNMIVSGEYTTTVVQVYMRPRLLNGMFPKSQTFIRIIWPTCLSFVKIKVALHFRLSSSAVPPPHYSHFVLWRVRGWESWIGAIFHVGDLVCTAELLYRSLHLAHHLMGMIRPQCNRMHMKSTLHHSLGYPGESTIASNLG